MAPAVCSIYDVTKVALSSVAARSIIDIRTSMIVSMVRGMGGFTSTSTKT